MAEHFSTTQPVSQDPTIECPIGNYPFIQLTNYIFSSSEFGNGEEEDGLSISSC